MAWSHSLEWWWSLDSGIGCHPFLPVQEHVCGRSLPQRLWMYLFHGGHGGEEFSFHPPPQSFFRQEYWKEAPSGPLPPRSFLLQLLCNPSVQIGSGLLSLGSRRVEDRFLVHGIEYLQEGRWSRNFPLPRWPWFLQLSYNLREGRRISVFSCESPYKLHIVCITATKWHVILRLSKANLDDTIAKMISPRKWRPSAPIRKVAIFSLSFTIL